MLIITLIMLAYASIYEITYRTHNHVSTIYQPLVNRYT